MTIPYSQREIPPFPTPIFGYVIALMIFYGINFMLNFMRPITNLYIIYFDLDLGAVPVLEIFDILNFIFGILVLIFGFLMFYYRTITRSLLIFGGIVFILFNLLNPSHFIIFGGLISMTFGNVPAWLSVIPPNLLGIYLASWTVLSLSQVLLQLVGFYVAIRFLTNSKPKKALLLYLLFYCWVSIITGIILVVQATLVQSISASWGALSLFNHVFRYATWITMLITGLTGIIFIWFWLKGQIRQHLVKLGQISLLSYAVNLAFVSFSDFAMKTYFALLINSILVAILIFVALKIPTFMGLEGEKPP
jgi:hypothetical protein